MKDKRRSSPGTRTLPCIVERGRMVRLCSHFSETFMLHTRRVLPWLHSCSSNTLEYDKLAYGRIRTVPSPLFFSPGFVGSFEMGIFISNGN